MIMLNKVVRFIKNQSKYERTNRWRVVLICRYSTLLGLLTIAYERHRRVNSTYQVLTIINMSPGHQCWGWKGGRGQSLSKLENKLIDQWVRKWKWEINWVISEKESESGKYWLISGFTRKWKILILSIGIFLKYLMRSPSPPKDCLLEVVTDQWPVFVVRQKLDQMLAQTCQKKCTGKGYQLRHGHAFIHE